MNKRIFAFITALMLMLSCVSFAEEIPTEEGFIPTEEIRKEDEVPAAEPVEEAAKEETAAEPVEEAAEEEAAAEPVEEAAEEEAAAEPIEEAAEEEAVAEPIEEAAEEEAVAELVEEAAEEEATAELVEEAAEEETTAEPVEEAAEEEATAEPVEEITDEEFSAEPAEEAAEAVDVVLHFNSGYVYLPIGTKIYKAVGGGEAYGVLAGGGNVYAENIVENEDPADDWIEVIFAYEGSVCHGYVKFTRVKVLDESEARQAVDAARSLSSTLWDGNIAVMALLFAVSEAEISEVTAVEEAASIEETDAVFKMIFDEEASPETVRVIETFEGTEFETFEAVDENESEDTPYVGVNVSTVADEEIVIVTQPMDFVGDIGDTVTFNVEAIGSCLTYRWKYRLKGRTEWKNAGMDGSTTAAMSGVVDGTRLKNEYCCFIMDAAGNTVQTDVVCIVKPVEPVAIFVQPVDCVGDIGDTVTFSVKATGTSLKYQWKYRLKGRTAWKNAGMDGSTTASMSGEVNSDRLKNEYCCFITDAAGNTVQTDVVYIVKPVEPVAISVQPVDCEGNIGDTVTFSVKATGTGLKYQWKYRLKGKTAWKNAGMDGSTTASMSGEVNSDRLKNEYCCFITDAAGNTVQTDVVYIVKPVEPVAISVQPVDCEGNIGDTVTFSVEATGTGLKYQWKYRLKGRTAWKNAGMDGSTTASMSGEVNSDRLKNEYCCFISDTAGNTVQTDVVYIVKPVEPVAISVQPVDCEGNIGDTVTFSVEATGTGLKYQWKYRLKGKTAWKNAGMDGSTTAAMSGEVNSDRQKNEYCCFITDAAGNTVQTDVVYIVKPVVTLAITTQPENYLGNVGDTVEFCVEAVGTGLTYQWKYRVKGKTAWANAGMTGKTTAKMTGEMTKARLGYEYCCVIKDASGATLQTDVVCMVEKIPLVITEEPQNAVITGGDAVFTIVATGNEPAYLWQIKNPGDEDWSDTACTADTFTVAAADCVNGMEVRCVVTDGYGDSITSATAAMTVLAAEITECVVSAENEVQLTVDCSAAGVEFRVIEVLDEEEILVTTSSETVITLQNVALGEHTYYVSVYYEGEDLIDTEPVSILCDKAKVNDVLYTLGEDDKLTVTGYIGTASSLVIPETVDGFTVTVVGASAFEGNTALHEIDLPDTITAIGSRAFKNCSNLSSMH